MNTIGKILVILNFVFAVAVGAFLTIDFATRANWKAAYDKLRLEVEVVDKSREAEGQVGVSVINKYRDAQQKIDQMKQALADQEALAATNEANFRAQLGEAQKSAKDADLSVQKALGDVDRMKVAVKELNAIVAEREQFSLKLQEDVKKYRTEALANDALAKSLQSRNEQLLSEVQRLTTEIAKRDTTTGGTGTLSKSGNEPNPPPNFVKGTVEKVEDGLVKLSVGTDQGVNKNHTLEAYRVRPDAKYLGLIRITEAYHNYSVGRLMAGPGGVRPQLKEGDIVSSSLSANR